MSGLPAYRVEWRLAAPGGAGAPVTRWSGHVDAVAARAAALETLACAIPIDGELRIATGATDDGPAAAAITDAEGLRAWNPASERLPADRPDSTWSRQRERAGLRAAILLACRSAMTRGVSAGVLAKARAASALSLIALALDGDDPAAPLGPAD